MKRTALFPMKRLKEYHREQRLVSIRREPIDAHKLHGFLLDFSSELVLMQQEYDFRLDGLRAIRTSDITKIKSSGTNEFQKRLLIEEQIFQTIDFDATFDLSNWKSLLTQFAQRYSLVILENEQAEERLFLIGRIRKIGDESVWIHYFDGDGSWDEEPTEMPFANITSCQINTNYINFYQRYFERTNQLAPLSEPI